MAMTSCIDVKMAIDEMVSRWGCASSEAILDIACQYFSHPHLEGVIGYRSSPGWAIVFGDPICPSNNISALTKAFHEECEKNNLRIAYLCVSEKFADWAMDHVCSIKLEVGEELIFNPQEDPCQGHKRWRLRNTINFPVRQGVKVEEYLTQDPEIEKAILEIGKTWVAARTGAQIHTGSIEFFKHRNHKRWFYLTYRDVCIGMALLCRLEAHDGWLLKYLITVPHVPRGTSELLMVSILNKLKEEGCQFLTYGMVPAKQLGEVQGISRLSEWMARMCYRGAKRYFHLENRKDYWNKFRPSSLPQYVLFDKNQFGISEIYTVINALQIERA